MASMDGWMDPHLYLGLLLHLVALIRQWFYIKLAINSIFTLTQGTTLWIQAISLFCINTMR